MGQVYYVQANQYLLFRLVGSTLFGRFSALTCQATPNCSLYYGKIETTSSMTVFLSVFLFLTYNRECMEAVIIFLGVIKGG